MSGSLRVLGLCLVGSLMLSSCTSGGQPEHDAGDAGAAVSGNRRQFVADSSVELPRNWSYMVARQGAVTSGRGSWSFTMSPFPFNLGSRCNRRTGPLVGTLFRRAEVFITGTAYVSEFPPSARKMKQTPGEFFLDDATLTNYEGFCVPTYRIAFAFHDYYVSMHVAVHRKASDATIDQA
ncbi:MAG TPA: hypothetical protein VEV82_08895, partial [Actinomycetota bacterium]|nr:hypothetical protein [Actinomycetota bacterium]